MELNSQQTKIFNKQVLDLEDTKIDISRSSVIFTIIILSLHDLSCGAMNDLWNQHCVMSYIAHMWENRTKCVYMKLEEKYASLVAFY